MATLDDVAALASALPEVTEGERHGNRTWYVAGWLACAPPKLAARYLER